jgi:sugar lactone lactonase YvrE
MRIDPGGEQVIITAERSGEFADARSQANRYLTGTLPNGLAFLRCGEIAVANFGTDRLELLSREGELRVLADSIEGLPIGKVNFVLRDSRDRLWVTVSTRLKNWIHALRSDLSDGYIACYHDGEFRVVADGFHFTNELRFDANEEFLYVVETTAGCITRLRVDGKGTLRNRETFGPSNLGKGAWPDGIAFDRFGNLWGTMVYSDKLFVITPEGELRILLDEGDASKVEALERQFFEGKVTEQTLFATGRGIAPWMASITFAGPDLRTAYVGSLKGTRIPFFRAPVPGLPMIHWNES